MPKPFHHCCSAGTSAPFFVALIILLGPGSPTASAKPPGEAERQHWAFRPLKRTEPPALKNAPAGSANPIDRFIFSRLEANGLSPAPPARKEQLIRRVTYGLIGLPPSPAEIDAFLNDPSPGAYEQMVERLLASPHYGERWGRHWLDLARFAESDGFEHDAPRPHSWRYRDYVVNSFNADKPFDRFIREQIAGDELYPDQPEALMATSFNLLGPDMVDSADQVQRRHNSLNDMTDTLALVFLGQTIGCARCHNHKSEPFTQRDYYRLQAFFVPAEFRRELPVPTAVERAEHERQTAEYQARTDATRKQIEAIEAAHRDRLHSEKLARLSEEAQLAHRTPREKRTVEMENQIQETAELLKISEAELVKSLSAEEQAQRQALLGELRKFPKPAPLPLAMALQNKNGAEAKAFLLERGDYANPGEPVAPGVPEVLGAGSTGLKESTPGRPRSALAEWIASPDNPLTARVMVNRVWQHHFGRGIVPTPSDFGTRGQPPTHPDLLDWLAGAFIDGGWSLKRIHKLILLSRAYQQSSEPTPEARARDPGNQWFSRQNRVRLEGEAIRDSLLAVSGRLNRSVGGPSVFPPLPGDIARSSRSWNVSTNLADHSRRSLYIFGRRNLRYPFLEVFDAPDNNFSCPERGRSTTAPQSLTLLNSEEVMAAAQAVAVSLSAGAGPLEARINHVFKLVIGRHPSTSERAAARAFLEPPTAPGPEGGENGGRGGSPSTFVWTEFCRALFNLNAFVYVE